MTISPKRNDRVAHHSTSTVLGRVALALGLEAILALGCAFGSTPPPPAVPALTSATASPAPRLVTASSSDVSVSDELASICNVDFDDIESAPKFDFARSDLLVEDNEVLSQIARCLTTGTLAGRALVLIGRADLRGESEYNMALGERRASSVRAHLMNLGIPPSKLTSTSRGNLDAVGTDTLGWLRDRRVDISLR